MRGNNLQSEVIRKLKYWRKINKWSQSTLADQLNISLKTYQNLENGVTKMDLDRLEQLSNLFKVDINEMLGLSEVVFDEHKISALIRNELLAEKERYIRFLELDNADLRNVLKYLQEQISE